MLFAAKILIAALLFAIISEVSKRYTPLAGLLSALPWITLLVLLTRHHVDKAADQHVADYLIATFWFILPTLLFVGLMAVMLRWSYGFYPALLTSLGAAMAANYLVMHLLVRFSGKV